MAGNSSPQRATIRRDALIRFGINRDGDAPQRLVDYMNQAIQSAHTRFYKKFYWVRRRVVIEVELTDNQGVIAIPEGTKPALIEWIWVQSSDDNQQPNIWRLNKIGSITPEERYTATLGAGSGPDPQQSGPPRIWWIENDEIHFEVTAGENWDTMFIQYQERETPVREDTDYLAVDEELMIQEAVIACKNFFEENTTEEKQIREDYIQDLLSTDGEEDSEIIFGGMRSISTRKRPVHDRISGFYGGTGRGVGRHLGPDGRVWPNGGPYA